MKIVAVNIKIIIFLKGVELILAKLLYKETTRSFLSQLDVSAGQIIRCTDTEEVYFDPTNLIRVKTSRTQLIEDEDTRTAMTDMNKEILYIVLETKAFYRYRSSDWALVTKTSDITDIIAIYTGLTVGTAIKGVNASDSEKVRYAPRTLAKAVYTEEGNSVEDCLKHITQLGTAISYVTATSNNQTTFKIPFPFDDYLSGGNTFMIFIGTTFVDNRRWAYSDDQTSITFVNGTTVKSGRSVTFVFLYNSISPVNTDVVNVSMDGKYIANSSLPIIKLEKFSNSLYDNDINSVATSAAVAKLYESLLTKLDALGSKYAVYVQTTGTGSALKATVSNFTLTDFSIIHARLNTSIEADATLTFNGKTIPIYRDFFNTIQRGDAFEKDVLSLFYNADENRFYMFDGIQYRLHTTHLMYTTVQNDEDTFDISALDYLATVDKLDVYQDGIHLVEGANFENNYNGTISLLGYTAEKDTEFTFSCTGIYKMNINQPHSAENIPTVDNPGGDGEIFNQDSETAESASIGNWKLYTDSTGSNNLLFLYNGVLKVTMTPTGEVVASEYEERDS